MFSMPLRNDEFVWANKDQHQVDKVTTSTVKYVENPVSYLLVLKAIRTNMSDLLLHIIRFMRDKAIDNAQSEVKILRNLAGRKSLLRARKT